MFTSMFNDFIGVWNALVKVTVEYAKLCPLGPVAIVVALVFWIRFLLLLYVSDGSGNSSKSKKE